ncbi:MAG: C45 family autoproteolytic acyltransferase/hydrolase [Breznakibacter sp.]
MRRFLRVLLIITVVLAIVVLLGVWGFNLATRLEAPEVENHFDPSEAKKIVGENIYAFQDSWLKKNPLGIWEMYVSGNAFEMGYKNGILTDSLNALQEFYFVNSIRKMIPSESYLNTLKYFLAWYNRGLNSYVPQEYREEIYGVSLFASGDYTFIGDPYPRMLNYHAAHDIGHALQNMNLVACTAFMVKDGRSADSAMIIGRNMDFSVGDDFAENKIVAFYRPEHGHNFAYITWPGMIGVVSGMNDQGLVVTLNAAKSDIPFSAKTPVSILARQVLQHAATIDEAYAIIKNTEVFVAESFLIGSARDNRTVVVEKAIDQTAVYDTQSDKLVLTNHYQSKELAGTKLNIESLEDGSSPYRLQRVNELLDSRPVHTPESFAGILRDQRGMGDKNIGLGNEKAINQLIAHHSVIFKPGKLQMWVSANPYQLGCYVCYDLKSIFGGGRDFTRRVDDSTLLIPEDEFLHSPGFGQFKEYKALTAKYKKMLWDDRASELSDGELQHYSSLNPEFFYTWFMMGEIWNAKGETAKALECYARALEKEIARLGEKEMIEKRIEKITAQK